jgi:hypothetical protein
VLTSRISAYIAASRRSDRSLEARIESARRASEIHKKRTGRGLRVTEQDVINEEMYEEEDDEIPSQLHRMTAHFNTNSLMFNRKLQDYIATQAAVRQSFYAQYTNPAFGHYNPSLQTQAGGQFSQGMNPFMHQQMPPPTFNQSSPTFNQSPQSFAPQSYRAAPYNVPQRPNAHQRSASLSSPQQRQGFQQSQFSNNGPGTPQGEEQRRLSLPPQALEQASQHFVDSPSRPTLSRSTTAQNVQHIDRSPQQLSPQNNSPSSAHSTPTLRAGTSPENTTPMGFNPQLLHSNLLSLSLPPESQQLIAPAMDPNDPTTAMFMAGSENIPMPVPTYHYNPNLSPKSSRLTGTVTPGVTLLTEPVTPASDGAMKSHGSSDGMPLADPSSVMSEEFMFSSMMSNPLSFDLGGQGDLFQSMGLPPSQEDYDPSVFVNFDQS